MIGANDLPTVKEPQNNAAEKKRKPQAERQQRLIDAERRIVEYLGDGRIRSAHDMQEATGIDVKYLCVVLPNMRRRGLLRRVAGYRKTWMLA
jgi:hypothetical protein